MPHKTCSPRRCLRSTTPRASRNCRRRRNQRQGSRLCNLQSQMILLKLLTPVRHILTRIRMRSRLCRATTQNSLHGNTKSCNSPLNPPLRWLNQRLQVSLRAHLTRNQRSRKVLRCPDSKLSKMINLGVPKIWGWLTVKISVYLLMRTNLLRKVQKFKRTKTLKIPKWCLILS